MKYIFISFIFISISCSHHQWGYKGNYSPDHWSELSKDYQACQLGKKQSPIDLIYTQAKTQDHPLQFYYHPSPAKIINNGHTIEFDLEEENYLMADGKKFKLIQFHFHAPSEHTIENRHYPAELHLVHMAKDQSLAVVGILLKVAQHDQLDHIFDKIPKQNQTQHTESIHLERLVSKANAHFYYRGSLTTPPCSEDVKWIVLDRHVKIHPDQLKKFKAIYSGNNRPLQKDNKRKIYHSSH